MQINNKKDIDKLHQQFYNLEVFVRRDVSIKMILTLLWWSWFKKYRAIIFMQRCVNGMHYKYSFRDAGILNKNNSLLLLKMLNWD